MHPQGKDEGYLAGRTRVAKDRAQAPRPTPRPEGFRSVPRGLPSKSTGNNDRQPGRGPVGASDDDVPSGAEAGDRSRVCPLEADRTRVGHERVSRCSIDRESASAPVPGVPRPGQEGHGHPASGPRGGTGFSIPTASSDPSRGDASLSGPSCARLRRFNASRIKQALKRIGRWLRIRFYHAFNRHRPRS